MKKYVIFAKTCKTLSITPIIKPGNPPTAMGWKDISR